MRSRWRASRTTAPASTTGTTVAMAEVDRARSAPEVVTDYMVAFLRAVGVPEDDVAAGCTRPRAGARRARLAPARCPAPGRPRPGSPTPACRLAVTSNSDGTVADMLRRHEILQVGPGPGIEVAHISDSGVLGVHKPDAAMFEATAAGLGLPLGRICHIGDAGGYDADGAAAAGMLAVHVDPLGLCPGRPRPRDVAGRLRRPAARRRLTRPVKSPLRSDP